MKTIRKRVGSLAGLLLVTVAVAAETNPVQHINPAAAQNLITGKKVMVLDVRTPKEFAAGHIAGATNINFLAPDFATAIAGLDTNQTYLIHCAVGGRSTQALPMLKKLHLPALYHLDGGIKAWEKAGFARSEMTALPPGATRLGDSGVTCNRLYRLINESSPARAPAQPTCCVP